MSEKGFTLVELMIVVAILAILAAVSVGIYNSFIKTGFEVDPVSILIQAGSAQEQYREDHGCYATYVEDLPGFDDGNKDNSFVIHDDKDQRRKLILNVDSSTNCTYYKIVIRNVTDDPKWQIQWEMNCTSTSPIGACKPVQVKGSGALKRIF